MEKVRLMQRDTIDRPFAKKPGPAWVALPGKVQSEFSVYANMWENHCIGVIKIIFNFMIQKVELRVKKIWVYSLFQLV